MTLLYDPDILKNIVGLVFLIQINIEGWAMVSLFKIQASYDDLKKSTNA
jgi:hypothetical protein